MIVYIVKLNFFLMVLVFQCDFSFNEYLVLTDAQNVSLFMVLCMTILTIKSQDLFHQKIFKTIISIARLKKLRMPNHRILYKIIVKICGRNLRNFELIYCKIFALKVKNKYFYIPYSIRF